MFSIALTLTTLLVAASAKLEVSITGFDIQRGCFLDGSGLTIGDENGVGVLDGILKITRDLGDRLLVQAVVNTVKAGLLDELSFQMDLELCNSREEGNEEAKKLIGPIFEPLGETCPFKEGSYPYDNVRLNSEAFDPEDGDQYNILFTVVAAELGECLIDVTAEATSA